MKKIRAIDLFAGVGGLSYGFIHNDAFEVVMANEYDKDISIAYSLNHPSVEMINDDIRNLDEKTLHRVMGKDRIDLIIGGPPCQSYSTVGKRQMDDRANLFLEYKRVLSIVKPKAFVFENVVGILSMDHGKLFPRIRAEFEELGYQLKYQVLNAVNYGVPQERERVILVGYLGENVFEYPKPTHGAFGASLSRGLKAPVCLRDAIGDLPELKSGESADYYLHDPDNEFLNFVRSNGSQIVVEHEAPKNGAHLVKIMETLKDGQSKDDLPEEIRPKSGYGNTYAKLWWNRPSTTITRNFACPSSSRCIHPRDSRAMSIREGARLQSFPDDYIFYGSDGTKRLEIGNAVPPLLSVAIAKQVLKMFKKNEE